MPPRPPSSGDDELSERHDKLAAWHAWGGPSPAQQAWQATSDALGGASAAADGVLSAGAAVRRWAAGGVYDWAMLPAKEWTAAEDKAVAALRENGAHLTSLASLGLANGGIGGGGAAGPGGAPRLRSELLLERATPHLDKLADALKQPVSEWSVTQVASDRLSRMLPQPVWVTLGFGYLWSIMSALMFDPTAFALTMMAI
tara:strand:- start:547 stop:1146 length:600 start_codon:yes stop_codon:yes gene_type:complete